MFGLLMLKFTHFAIAFGAKCDPNSDNPKYDFFNFPHWWKYIHSGTGDIYGNCIPSVKFPDGILAIGLAVIDMLLYAAGIVAVISIIIAGISYITAAGSSEKVSAAHKRIQNALIGLVIVVLASALVSFIGNSVG